MHHRLTLRCHKMELNVLLTSGTYMRAHSLFHWLPGVLYTYCAFHYKRLRYLHRSSAWKIKITTMKCLKTFAVLAVLYMRSAVAASTCLPLITDCSICAISPGIISSDGFDDVCNLVDCCNGGSTLSVKIPSGSTIACKDVDCKSVCNLSLARNGGNDANEACINTCTPPSFDWAPLVQRACNDYNQASGIAPQTLGYFGQVRNIVCSAAKSLDPCCGDMRLTYGACDTLWAGQFVEFVFNV